MYSSWGPLTPSTDKSIVIEFNNGAVNLFEYSSVPVAVNLAVSETGIWAGSKVYFI